MKRHLFVSLVAFTLILMGALPLTAASQQETIKLRFTNFFPATHKNSIVSEQWCKEVEKRTAGRVRIEYYPGASLIRPERTYDSVEKGIVDIGQSLMGYTVGRFPLSQGIDLPLGYKSGLVATKMANEFYTKFKPKEFDQVKVLYLHAHGPGLLSTKKAVARLEDLKGLRIRTSGETTKIAKALGAVPVGIPQTETYDALVNAAVDGVLSPIEAMKGFKLGEVAINHTLNFGSAYSSGFFVVMNKAKWNSLPPDIQKIIEQINQEWIEKQGKVWDEVDHEAYSFLKARGNKIILLSKEEDVRWATAVRPVIDDYIKAMKAKGLPAEEAVKFFQDYLRTHQK